VLGRLARVSGGEFSAQVPLRQGANLIDVGASARGAGSTWTALRVVREVLIEMPDVGGESADLAIGALKGLGLRTEVRERDGLFDELLPGPARVCEQRPRAEARVTKGTRVALTVSKGC
jgi:beta-lactam-binding protein with PASTA domain